MGKVKQAEIAKLPDHYALYPDEDDHAATSMPGMRQAHPGVTLQDLPVPDTEDTPLDTQA